MTGQVVADAAMRDQLAALLHETGPCYRAADGTPYCEPEDHREAADAVLSWLLSQGATEQKTRLGHASQRRVVSVCSAWTTVERDEQ